MTSKVFKEQLKAVKEANQWCPPDWPI